MRRRTRRLFLQVAEQLQLQAAGRDASATFPPASSLLRAAAASAPGAQGQTIRWYSGGHKASTCMTDASKSSQTSDANVWGVPVIPGACLQGVQTHQWLPTYRQQLLLPPAWGAANITRDATQGLQCPQPSQPFSVSTRGLAHLRFGLTDAERSNGLTEEDQQYLALGLEHTEAKDAGSEVNLNEAWDKNAFMTMRQEWSKKATPEFDENRAKAVAAIKRVRSLGKLRSVIEWYEAQNDKQLLIYSILQVARFWRWAYKEGRENPQEGHKAAGLLVDDLCQLLLLHLSSLTPHEICHLFWAFARMDHVPNSTLPQQMMTMLAKDDFAMLKSEDLHKYFPRRLTSFVWALSKLGDRINPQDSLQVWSTAADTSAQMVVNIMKNPEPQPVLHVLNLLTSFASAPIPWMKIEKRRWLLHQTLPLVMTMLPLYDAPAAATILYSLARLRLDGAPKAIVYSTAHLTRLRETADLQMISNALWAYGQWSNLNPLFPPSIVTPYMAQLAHKACRELAWAEHDMGVKVAGAARRTFTGASTGGLAGAGQVLPTTKRLAQGSKSAASIEVDDLGDEVNRHSGVLDMFRIHQGRLLFKPMQPPQSNAQSKKKKGAQQQPSGPAVVWSWPPSRPPVLEFQEVWSKIQSAHFKNKVDYSAEPPIPITKDLRPWPPSARGRDESSPKGQGPHPGIPEPEMWSQTYTGGLLGCLTDLKDRAVAMAPRATIQTMMNIVWACSRLLLHCDNLLDVVKKELPRMSAHLHNQDISLLALAIGILDGGRHHAALVEDLSSLLLQIVTGGGGGKVAPVDGIPLLAGTLPTNPKWGRQDPLLQSTLHLMTAHVLCDSVGTPAFRRFVLGKLKEWSGSAVFNEDERVAIMIHSYLMVCSEIEWERARRQLPAGCVPDTVWAYPPKADHGGDLSGRPWPGFEGPGHWRGARRSKSSESARGQSTGAALHWAPAVLPWDEPWLQQVAEKARKVYQDGAEKFKATAFQIRIRMALELMQVYLAEPGAWAHRPLSEQLTDDGAVSVDILMTSRCKRVKVAVEADGPYHFMLNNRSIHTGQTWRRARALMRRGYILLPVPYYEWSAMKPADHVVQVDFLRQRLRQVLLEALGPPGDPATQEWVNRLVGPPCELEAGSLPRLSKQRDVEPAPPKVWLNHWQDPRTGKLLLDAPADDKSRGEEDTSEEEGTGTEDQQQQQQEEEEVLPKEAGGYTPTTPTSTSTTTPTSAEDLPSTLAPPPPPPSRPPPKEASPTPPQLTTPPPMPAVNNGTEQSKKARKRKRKSKRSKKPAT